MEDMQYQAHPSLNFPALIMGFSGWPNAGEVATGTMDYIFNKLDHHPLAVIDPDRYLCYTEERPTASILGGKITDFTSPTGRFSYVKGHNGDSDLILFSGPEPNLAWRSYCEQVLSLTREMKVRLVVTLGGSYDYLPHWVESKVSAVYSSVEAEKLMLPVKKELKPSFYQGPISIHSMLTLRAREQGLPVVGLWGHAPIYIQSGNYKIHKAMADILSASLGFSMDTSDLLGEIASMDRRISDLAEENPRLKEYIEELSREKSPKPDLAPPPQRAGSNGPKGKVIPLSNFYRKDE